MCWRFHIRTPSLEVNSPSDVAMNIQKNYAIRRQVIHLTGVRSRLPHDPFNGRPLAAELRNQSNLDDVVHQTVAEHPVQLNLVVLQNVLQTAARTIFRQQRAVRRCNASSDETHQMVVSQVFHLHPRASISSRFIRLPAKPINQRGQSSN